MSKQYVYKAPILGVKYNRYRNNIDDNEIEQTTQTISLEWKYSLNDSLIFSSNENTCLSTVKKTF